MGNSKSRHGHGGHGSHSQQHPHSQHHPGHKSQPQLHKNKTPSRSTLNTLGNSLGNNGGLPSPAPQNGTGQYSHGNGSTPINLGSAPVAVTNGAAIGLPLGVMTPISVIGGDGVLIHTHGGMVMAANDYPNTPGMSPRPVNDSTSGMMYSKSMRMPSTSNGLAGAGYDDSAEFDRGSPLMPNNANNTNNIQDGQSDSASPRATNGRISSSANLPSVTYYSPMTTYQAQTPQLMLGQPIVPSPVLNAAMSNAHKGGMAMWEDENSVDPALTPLMGNSPAVTFGKADFDENVASPSSPLAGRAINGNGNGNTITTSQHQALFRQQQQQAMILQQQKQQQIASLMWQHQQQLQQQQLSPQQHPKPPRTLSMQQNYQQQSPALTPIMAPNYPIDVNAQTSIYQHQGIHILAPTDLNQHQQQPGYTSNTNPNVNNNSTPNVNNNNNGTANRHSSFARTTEIPPGAGGPLLSLGGASTASRQSVSQQVFANLAQRYPSNPKEAEKREWIANWNRTTVASQSLVGTSDDPKPTTNSQFHLYRYAFELAIIAPVGKRIKSILDIGCTSGEWILDMAYKFPKTELYGVDSALDHSKIPFRPPNCVFEQGHILDGLRFRSGKFDLVHQRLVAFTIPIRAWTPLFAELVRLTRPGGWIQLAESKGQIVTPGIKTVKLNNWIQQASLRSGYNPTQIVDALMPTAFGAGLINVERVSFFVPVGRWAGAEGEIVLNTYLRMVMSLRDEIVEIAGLDPGKFDELIESVQEECEARKSCLQMTIMFAQKPPFTD